ncbi:MAG TPA: hypothetical protein VKU90_16360 [Caulobacteraceae bacterium]|nr:hypothetical protein [Caulobacteraceae bacterium]
MPGQGASPDNVLRVAKAFAKRDEDGAKRVDVSLVSSATGLSNTAVTEIVGQLADHGASIRLDADNDQAIVVE